MTIKKPSPRRARASSAPASSAPSSSAPAVTSVATTTVAAPDARRHQIEVEAYLLAERRGFAPGGELGDWLEAERIIADRDRADRAGVA